MWRISQSNSNCMPRVRYRSGHDPKRDGSWLYGKRNSKNNSDQLYVINEKNYNYINVLSAYVGTKLMEKYPADYIFRKYRQRQLDMCAELNLEPSPCVYFGIDKQGQFPEYNRGTETNRLCFSRVWDGRMTHE